jgi:hypothetical protein
MVAAGLGFAFMPADAASHPEVVALPVVEPEFWRVVNLVTVRGRRYSDWSGCAGAGSNAQEMVRREGPFRAPHRRKARRPRLNNTPRSASFVTISRWRERGVETQRPASGHEERFPPRSRSGRCGFRKETIVGLRRNGRDAQRGRSPRTPLIGLSARPSSLCNTSSMERCELAHESPSVAALLGGCLRHPPSDR